MSSNVWMPGGDWSKQPDNDDGVSLWLSRFSNVPYHIYNVREEWSIRDDLRPWGTVAGPFPDKAAACTAYLIICSAYIY